jgi:hypothetical protein
MAEFGNQYNSLQGFAYSITAVINALAQINTTVGNLAPALTIPELINLDNGFTVTNNTGVTNTFTLNPTVSCVKVKGIILQADDENTNDIIINNSVKLKPGSILTLTVERYRLFGHLSLRVTLQPNNSVRYVYVCGS